MALERELADLGLPPKEAKVYLTLLELGTASVQALARRAGIVRPTTYVVLGALMRKGLVSKATGPDAQKMLFTAESPERLSAFLEREGQALERRRRLLAELIPELRSVHLSGEEKPRVRLFEGKDGLRELQKEFVRVSKEPIVGMSPEDELRELFPEEEFNRDIRGVRVSMGVHSRHLYTSSHGVRFAREEDFKLLRESRYVSKDALPIKASFAVHGPILSIVSFRNKIIGVLIEHPDIADSFRSIFESLWEAAALPLVKSREGPTTKTTPLDTES